MTNRSKPIPAWAQRPDVLDYIVACYGGTDPIAGTRKTRRVFLWEDRGAVMMGNTEAFALHLRERFGLVSGYGAIATILHTVLRELGERARAGHEQHASPTGPGGKFRQPEPEQWVVRRKASDAPGGEGGAE